MFSKLHLNGLAHSAIVQLTRPGDCRRARTFRKAARSALKKKDFTSASDAILEAIACNPTIRDGAQLLARAKSGEVKTGTVYFAEEPRALRAREIEQSLEQDRPVSDPVIEVLTVLRAWRGDATSAIETLARMRSRRRQSIFTKPFLDLLFRAISHPDELRRLLSLVADFGGKEITGWPSGIVNKWLASEMAFGVTHHGPHPLLDPEVFSAFTRTVRRGEPAVASLPAELQRLIASGQVRTDRKFGNRECRKILVVSENWNFFSLAARALETSGFDVRFLDFEIIRHAFPNSDRALPLSRLTRSLVARPAAEDVREALAARSGLANDLLDWADVVFCEWFTDAAVWMSRYVQDDKMLISRLHSYEAFTAYPLYANLRRVDGLIFIAPHIQEILASLVGKDVLSDTVTRVIPNFRAVSHYTFAPRDEDAKRTLGMTQYASLNKDPAFALDILESLLADDSRWRLRLVGAPWAAELPEKEAIYSANFRQRLIGLGDRVSINCYTSDMASWYRSIGFIVSASLREGSHESLVEGMLTGAVPVLRNWPMMAPFGAPASVFPGLEPFDSAEAAARYIRDAAAHFDERSIAAARYGLDHVNSVDPAVELPRFIRTVCEARALPKKPATP